MNHYTILMMGYNSKEWIHQSLNSAMKQNHDNYDVIAIDAETTDGTYDVLLEYEQEYKNLTVVRNSPRQCQTQNVYDGCRMVKDKSIIVTLDLDDWFPHDNVLNVLDNYYNEDIWMTYGSMYQTGNPHIVGLGRHSNHVIENNLFRQDDWKASHLRTYRKELIMQVDDSYLKDSNGNWLSSAGDVAEMVTMLELCGERFCFIPEPLYVWNRGNILSEMYHHVEEQLECSRIIAEKTPCTRIDSL